MNRLMTRRERDAYRASWQNVSNELGDDMEMLEKEEQLKVCTCSFVASASLHIFSPPSLQEYVSVDNVAMVREVISQHRFREAVSPRAPVAPDLLRRRRRLGVHLTDQDDNTLLHVAARSGALEVCVRKTRGECGDFEEIVECVALAGTALPS